jgi:micrococcal nuclease
MKRVAIRPGLILAGTRSLAAAVLLVATGLAHADFTGKVIAVLDGDTADVLVEQRPVRVRLAEIDAPEKGQAFGQRSRQALADLVFKRDVRVEEKGVDRYGRVLGIMYLPDHSCVVGVISCGPLNVNMSMVSVGMAWAYRRYLRDQRLIAVEAEARERRRGLWADTEPTPPWAWRTAQRAGAAAE